MSRKSVSRHESMERSYNRNEPNERSYSRNEPIERSYSRNESIERSYNRNSVLSAYNSLDENKTDDESLPSFSSLKPIRKIGKIKSPFIENEQQQLQLKEKNVFRRSYGPIENRITNASPTANHNQQNGGDLIKHEKVVLSKFNVEALTPSHNMPTPTAVTKSLPSGSGTWKSRYSRQLPTKQQIMDEKYAQYFGTKSSKPSEGPMSADRIKNIVDTRRARRDSNSDSYTNDYESSDSITPTPTPTGTIRDRSRPTNTKPNIAMAFNQYVRSINSGATNVEYHHRTNRSIRIPMPTPTLTPTDNLSPTPLSPASTARHSQTPTPMTSPIPTLMATPFSTPLLTPLLTPMPSPFSTPVLTPLSTPQSLGVTTSLQLLPDTSDDSIKFTNDDNNNNNYDTGKNKNDIINLYYNTNHINNGDIFTSNDQLMHKRREMIKRRRSNTIQPTLSATANSSTMIFNSKTKAAARRGQRSLTITHGVDPYPKEAKSIDDIAVTIEELRTAADDFDRIFASRFAKKP